MSVVALIGAPGSGKSTVGPLLAGRLKVRFTDVDAVIQERLGRPLRDIFADEGETSFRLIERDITVEHLARPGVVALGSGAPLTPAIAEALASVPTVWLQVDARNALKRIGLEESGVLTGGGVRATFIKLLNARTPVYRGLADVEIDTSDRDPDDLIDPILAALEAQ